MKYVKVKRSHRKRIKARATIIKHEIQKMSTWEALVIKTKAAERLGRPLTIV